MSQELSEGLVRQWPNFSDRQSAVLLFIGLAALLVTIYGPSVGHGFIKDDVTWVAANRVESWADVRALAFRTQGFYRPIVSASFALDRAVYGFQPLGYGFTNLALLLVDAFAVAWLARGLGYRLPWAVFAAAVWALNFHGINMAVLWLSGRTALLLVLAAVMSAGTFVRGRTLTAGVLAFAAMLAKEEAVLLPAILSFWAWQLASSERLSGKRARRAVSMAAPIWCSLALYLVCRAQTDAITPGNSPWFYRFTFEPAHLVANALEYVDRACTFSASAVIAASLLFQRWPWLRDVDRRILRLAVAWLLGAFAITVFLPVRSSLYACWPAVASALAVASIVEGIVSRSRAGDRMWRVAVAALLPVLLLPVYWARNVRWVELADLASDTVTTLQRLPPDTAHIVFKDDPSTRRSWRDAYGHALAEIVTLTLQHPVTVSIDPPLDGDSPTAAWPPAALPARTVTLRLRHGRMQQVQ